MIAYTWLKLHCDLAAPAQNSEALSHEAPFQKKKKNVFLDMISAPLKDRSFCKELLTEILLKHCMFSSSFQFFQQCQGSLSGKWCNNKVLITANCSAEHNYTPNVLPFNICLIDGPLSSFYLAYPITDESRVC